jgi:hypothetical protein
MQLKPGLRLQSVVCDTQVVVVKGSGEIDVRCGGSPMVPMGAEVDRGTIDDAFASGTLMGKRYADDDASIELLCTKPGAGALSIGDTIVPAKDAKPLPSSD